MLFTSCEILHTKETGSPRQIQNWSRVGRKNLHFGMLIPKPRTEHEKLHEKIFFLKKNRPSATIPLLLFPVPSRNTVTVPISTGGEQKSREAVADLGLVLLGFKGAP